MFSEDDNNYNKHTLSLTLDEPTPGVNVVEVFDATTINQLERLRDGHYKQIEVTYKNGLCPNLYKGQDVVVLRWRRNGLLRATASPASSMSTISPQGNNANNYEQVFAVDTFLGKDRTDSLFTFDVDERSLFSQFPELDFKLSDASLKRTVYGDVFSKCKLSTAAECHYVAILDKWIRVYTNSDARVVAFGITGADTLTISTLPTLDVGSIVDMLFIPRGLPVFNRLGNDIVACVGHRMPATGRCVVNCVSIDSISRISLKIAEVPVKFFKQPVDPERVATATLFKDEILYEQKRKILRKLTKKTEPLTVIMRENFKGVNVNFAQFGPDVVVFNITYPTNFVSSSSNLGATSNYAESSDERPNNKWRIEMTKNVYNHKDTKPAVDYTILWKDYATRYEAKYQFNNITSIY